MTSRTPRLDRVQVIHHDLSQGRREGDQPPAVDLATLPGTWELGTLDLLSDSLEFLSAVEELVETYLRNFTGRGIPKSRPVHTVNVNVLLTPEQMEEGWHLPIRVPTFDICPYCGGSGVPGFYRCDQCRGEGFTEQIRTADVVVRQHVGQGAVIPVSLQPMGIDNLYLNIHVSLQP